MTREDYYWTIDTLAPLLMRESLQAWEMGLQNCPGPITEDEARSKIKEALLRASPDFQ